MCTAVIVPIVRTIGAIHVSVVRRGTANAPVTSTDRNVMIQNGTEMNDILFKKIKRANSKYSEYLSACDKVAKAAQKHINWNDNVGCAYMPGDGLCIEIEAHVCPATRFFELPEIIGNDMIDEYTYRISCI